MNVGSSAVVVSKSVVAVSVETASANNVVFQARVGVAFALFIACPRAAAQRHR